jgi:hypothetical protein
MRRQAASGAICGESSPAMKMAWARQRRRQRKRGIENKRKQQKKTGNENISEVMKERK